jgi:2-polyprenyl-6-methoxyphenol hydroxylase-like FAD-dependent oxidoreductase
VLAEKILHNSIHRDKCCIGTIQGNNHIVMFDDHTSIRANLVLAADGFHSTVANQLLFGMGSKSMTSLLSRDCPPTTNLTQSKAGYCTGTVASWVLSLVFCHPVNRAHYGGAR